MEHSSLEKLQAFVSDNAQKIYANLQVPQKTIQLEEKEFIVPDKYADIVPMYAGETLKYSIVI